RLTPRSTLFPYTTLFRSYFFFPGFAQGFSWVLTYIGLGIFIILIAYDSQKLKKLADEAETLDAAGKYAVQGALMLYLDFINIFRSEEHTSELQSRENIVC